MEQGTSRAPAAARVLGRVAPRNDQRAIRALRAALSAGDPELRRAAAEGLCFIGKTEEALPLLLPALDEPFYGQQLRVLELIALLGPEARAAAPRLGELLSSEYTDMREGAARALRSIIAER